MELDNDVANDRPSRKKSGVSQSLAGVISNGRLPGTRHNANFAPTGASSRTTKMIMRERISVNLGEQSNALMYPPGLRRACWVLLDEERGRFDYAMSAIILANVCLMIKETDANAECASEDSIARCREDVLTVLNQVFLGIYTIEFTIRFYVYRRRFWNSYWNLLDFTVVILGYVDVVLLILETDKVPGPSMSLLRIFRVFRLMRAMKMFRKIKELHAMLRGFVSAMNSMFWGFVMIAVLLLIFAILCVELVNPISVRVHHENDCRDAFANVWYCMLMFFQALVAGDSWGKCTLPVIKDQFWTAGIFVVALVSIQLGFMNLILAVIVERAYDAKAQDEEEHRKETEDKEMAATKRLRNLFAAIDTDQSGSISLEELLDGYDYNDDMKNMFAMLDMSRLDLVELFKLMDVDDENDISYDSLINNLRAAIASDRKNLAMVRLQVAEVGRAVKKLNQEERRSSSLCSPATSRFGTRASTRVLTRGPSNVDTRAPYSSVDTISEISPVSYSLDPTKLGTALENLKREQGSETLQKTTSDVVLSSQSSFPSSQETAPRQRARKISVSSNAELELHALRDSIAREFFLLRNSIRVLIDSMGSLQGTSTASVQRREDLVFELGSDFKLEKTISMEHCLKKEDTGDLAAAELNQFTRRLCSPAAPMLRDNLQNNSPQDSLRNAGSPLKSLAKSLSPRRNGNDENLSGHRLSIQKKLLQSPSKDSKDSAQDSNGVKHNLLESTLSASSTKGDVSL